MAIQERFVVAKIDDLIPSAKEIQKQAALKETQKADEHAKRLATAFSGGVPGDISITISWDS